MRYKWRFINDLRGAWELLTDFPLPASSTGRAHASSGAETLVWFPVIGALCGALIAGAAKLISLATNPTAGATIFAIAATAFMLFKDSGRGMLILFSLFEKRLECGSFAAASHQLSSDRETVLRDPRFGARTVILAAAVIAEFIALFLLFAHGSALFLAAILTGSFAVQGFLAAAAPESGTPALVADDDGRGILRLLIASAVLALAALLRFPVATAFGVAVCCAVAIGLGGHLRRDFDEPEPDMITLGGAIAEAGLLLCGFLWTL